MTARTTTTEVPYSAAEMFALVADVERYPDFIPWCVALRIVERGEETLFADMIVAYRVFRERFRSRVTLDPAGGRITATYVDGPFRTLKNEWTFSDRAGGGSTIGFLIDFEFRNFILQATAQQVFDKAFAKMSDAFVTRAKAVYGERELQGARETVG
ncbi:MAG: type II toxin-antitoxin system RatA family toxin [Parvularculaceae bacterium]|nr:type II toxin-antitoxin system RatA family toxin [Parvularculaceae bacterium]